ncbi:MAG: twin-arginine translocation signal domain-containing protein [Phycisphaerales bacterium]|nr:twin-arginine translocation signal domain-containing protein [Phycisphaerales bacterium]
MATRREFLKKCTTVACAGAAIAAEQAADEAKLLSQSEDRQGTESSVMEQLTKERFSQQLNSRFRIRDTMSSDAIDVELVRVTEAHSTEAVEQFSVEFLGPEKPFFEQRMYRIEHPDMGSFDLFIVPIGQSQDGTTYQAVFSRMRQ